MKRLIIFLIRVKLGLKKYEPFQFSNQKTDAVYFFSSDTIYKSNKDVLTPSGVSLNWLLDADCKLVLVPVSTNPYLLLHLKEIRYGH